MQPSSVIFLVLLGVWAAYFLLYWVRRREHLATARTVDQLSASIRVLEPRVSAARAKTTRSYAVSPTRAVRAAQSDPPRTGPSVGTGAPGSDGDRRSDRSTGTVRAAQMHPGRRVRGVTLLLGLGATMVMVALAALSALPAWSVAPPAAVAMTGFLWLRSGVQQEIRARRGGLAHRARAAHAVEVVQAPGAEEAVQGPAAAPAPADAAAPADAPDTAPAAPQAPAAARDDAPAEPGPVVTVPAALLVDEDDIPLTWDPVPVPRPTYAMKAKAERPAPPPAATTPTPEPVVIEDPAAYAEPERRVAGA